MPISAEVTASLIAPGSVMRLRQYTSSGEAETNHTIVEVDREPEFRAMSDMATSWELLTDDGEVWSVQIRLNPTADGRLEIGSVIKISPRYSSQSLELVSIEPAEVAP